MKERIKTDPDFRALVANWESQLAELADQIDEMPPRQALKAELMKRAFGETPQTVSLWQRFGPWAWGTMAAAVVGIALLFGSQIFPTEQPTFVAEIVADDGSIAVTASYFSESQEVLVEVTSGSPPDGRVLQIWGIAERQAPVSIGIIPADGTGRFSIPQELLGKYAGLLCAISEEPLGGSPTGQPTGPVLAAAPLQPA